MFLRKCDVVSHLTAVCGDGTGQWSGLLDIMKVYSCVHAHTPPPPLPQPYSSGQQEPVSLDSLLALGGSFPTEAGRGCIPRSAWTSGQAELSQASGPALESQGDWGDLEPHWLIPARSLQAEPAPPTSPPPSPFAPFQPELGCVCSMGDALRPGE